MSRRWLLVVILFAGLVLLNGLSASYVQSAELPVTPIQSGEALKGEIKLADDIVRYSFTGQAGEAIIIWVAKTSGDLAPKLELFSPSGQRVAQDSRSNSARIDFTLKGSGTYTINVGANNAKTGVFTINFKKVSDGNGIPITSGGLLRGEIKLIGEMVWYTFEGKAGEPVVIRVVRMSEEEMYPALELFGPRGEEAGEDLDVPSALFEEDKRVARIDTVLKHSGTYTLMMRTLNARTGSYIVMFKNLTDGGGTPIPSGSLLQGEIKLIGEMVWYTFEGKAGEPVVIRVVRTSSEEMYPALEIFGPNGEKVGEDLRAAGGLFGSDKTVSRLDVTLKASGVYTVMVRALNAKTGSFIVSFKKLSDGIGTPITVGGLLHGEIKIPGDVGWFTFGGKAGEVAVIRLTRTSGDFTPKLELFGPTGETLVQGEGSDTTRVDFSLKTTGTYTIMVVAADTSFKACCGGWLDPSKLGSYTLSFNVGETLVEQKATIGNGTVNGDLNGTFDFPDLEMVSLKTGLFKGQGFAKGKWTAKLEDVAYAGDFRLTVSPASFGAGLRIQGAFSGDLSGVVDGSLTETNAGTGKYDKYNAVWKIGRVRGLQIPARIKLLGILNYQPSVEHPFTLVRTWQTSVTGDIRGDRTEIVDYVITGVRVEDEGDAYDGEGFSILSYASQSGLDNGWAYTVTSDRTTRFNGQLTGTFMGRVTGTLDEKAAPPSMSLSLERIDSGSPNSATQVKVWGPQRVSPGQTVDYLIEYRNNEVEKDRYPLLFFPLNDYTRFVSASAGHDYDQFYNQVSFDLGTMSPQSVKLKSIKVKVMEGLTSGTVLNNSVYAFDAPANEPKGNLPSLALNGVFTPQGSNNWKQWQKFAEGINANTVPIYQNPLIDLADAQGASPSYEEQPLTGIEPKGKVSINGKDYYVYFNADENNGLKNESIINPPSAYQDVFAFSAGTRTTVTAILYYNLRSKRLVLISPISGVREWGTYRWELEQIHARYPDMKIVIYQSKSDHLLKGLDWMVQAHFDENDPWLRNNNIEVNPKSLIVNGKELEINKDYINRLGHTELIEYIKGLIGSEGQSSSSPSVVATAHDPNIKYGPDGDISPGQRLTYKVEFENEGEGIAFGVYFTDMLDLNLDDSTLEIGPVISTTDGSVVAPAGKYSPVTRIITWQVGEVGPAAGGHSEFSVNVRKYALDSAEIINYATVYFPSVPEAIRTNGVVSLVRTPQNIAAGVIDKPGSRPSPEAAPSGETWRGLPLWYWFSILAIIMIISVTPFFVRKYYQRD